MRIIKSVNNPYIKNLSKLHLKKYRELEGKFLIEGYNLVNEAKAANLLLEVLITSEDERIEETVNTLVNEDIIKKLSKTKNPQNIVGVCKMKKAEELAGNKFLLLDNINDPGNLGTLIRTALGLGIDQIIVSSDTADLYNDKVIRAAQGALFKIDVIIGNLITYIEKLKAKKIPVIGTALVNSKSLKDIKTPNKYAIVLGNEANGIKDEILSLTDVNVKIEIDEKLESLNVAIAGAILMYHFNKE